MEKILDTIYESILDGEIKLVPDHVQAALDENLPPATILNDGMIAAMTEVGQLFEEGEYFVAAIKEHKPDVVGISALLTTTMPYMGNVVDAIKENGLRDDVAILIGGAPINDAYAEKIGADAFCKSAGMTADTAKRLMRSQAGNG